MSDFYILDFFVVLNGLASLILDHFDRNKKAFLPSTTVFPAESSGPPWQLGMDAVHGVTRVTGRSPVPSRQSLHGGG